MCPAAAFVAPLALAHGRVPPPRTRARSTVAPRASQRPALPKGFGTARPEGSDAGKMGFVGGKELGIAFTCGVCETRVAKRVMRQSYEKGVCLVQCPGCDKYHVIADNLGYYSCVRGLRSKLPSFCAPHSPTCRSAH
jgi:hypothetical protein